MIRNIVRCQARDTIFLPPGFTMHNSGRRIALFPGAFRPPHKAHFEAVRNLLARSDIDEVVIAVTNRDRHVPGTTQLLGTEMAQRIWSIYLDGLPRVRVEMAPGSAVEHVLSYTERAAAGDHLMYCVGEGDLDAGDRRFRNVQALVRERNLSAEVILAPTKELPGRAAGLRRAIAKGKHGKAQFFKALPDHLNHSQCEAVWQICLQGLKDVAVVNRDKVSEIIRTNQLGEIVSLEPARADKPDVVFRVGLSNGTNLFVKYANDTVKDATFADPLGPKPRSRLSAERRAIKWLHHNNPLGVELPEVVYFSKKNKALVLSEVGKGGQSLAECLRAGDFNHEIIAQAARFLSVCHHARQPLVPLWHDNDSDLNHWETMLALRTSGITNSAVSAESYLALEVLQCASRAAAGSRFVNLNLTAANILVARDRIGIIDFELCCSFGDPACDLGYFFGHYLASSLAGNRHKQAIPAIGYALDSYRLDVGDDWDAMQSRLPAFVGASLLACLSDRYASDFTADLRRSLISIAENLLRTVYVKNLDAGTALKEITTATL